MTYFKRIYEALEPNPRAVKHMEAAMYYMKHHINEASSSMKPKIKDFEFDFDWDCKNFAALGQTTAAKKNDLSDIKWNFSNLDRSDVSII